MKKNVLVSLLLAAVATVIGVAVLYGPKEANTGPTMELPADLARAISIMESIQSQALNPDNSTVTDAAGLEALGERVLDLQEVYDNSTNRISVLSDDRDYFEGLVEDRLRVIFPGEIGIEPAVLAMKKPGAFINAYSDYVSIFPSVMADSINVTRSTLPPSDDQFWGHAFEVTKDTREIIFRKRFQDWFTPYKASLCTTDDLTNETLAGGTVSLIAFSRDASGNIVYTATAGHADTCTTNSSGKPSVRQHQCIDNQYTNQTLTTECQYGCNQGACLPKPPTCTDSDGGKDFYKKGSTVYEAQGINDTDNDTCTTSTQLAEQFCPTDSSENAQEMYNCPHGCSDGACLPEPEPVVLSHFDLYTDILPINHIVAHDFEAPDMYQFSLVVIARNSDGSIATDYDGDGLIVITGDNDADYPEVVDLSLTNGRGSFPILLSKVDDVTISYKDVDNHIYGNSTISDLTLAPSSEATLDVSLSSDSPGDGYVLEDGVATLGFWDLTAENGDVLVTDLYFHNVTPSDTLADGRTSKYSLFIEGQAPVLLDTTNPIVGDIEFTVAAGDLLVPDGQTVKISLIAEFNHIDHELKTGAIFQPKLYSLEAEREIDGIDLETPDFIGVQEGDQASPSGIGVTANKFQLVKIQPILTTESIGSSLNDGSDEELYAVKVAADNLDPIGDPNDSISVHTLEFYAILSDRSDSDIGLEIDQYTLADSAGELDNYSCEDDNGDDNEAVSDGVSDTVIITCSLVSGAPISIGSGDAETFYLRADITGSSDDDRISVNMKESYYDFQIPKAAENVSQPSAIIWSDNAGTPESLTEAHWYGDESVPGLNTAAITLEG